METLLLRDWTEKRHKNFRSGHSPVTKYFAAILKSLFCLQPHYFQSFFPPTSPGKQWQDTFFKPVFDNKFWLCRAQWRGRKSNFVTMFISDNDNDKPTVTLYKRYQQSIAGPFHINKFLIRADKYLYQLWNVTPLSIVVLVRKLHAIYLSCLDIFNKYFKHFPNNFPNSSVNSNEAFGGKLHLNVHLKCPLNEIQLLMKEFVTDR